MKEKREKIMKWGKGKGRRDGDRKRCRRMRTARSKQRGRKEKG